MKDEYFSHSVPAECWATFRVLYQRFQISVWQGATGTRDKITTMDFNTMIFQLKYGIFRFLTYWASDCHFEQPSTLTSIHQLIYFYFKFNEMVIKTKLLRLYSFDCVGLFRLALRT